MRKASLKVEKSYHEGAYVMANEINSQIDALILESCHYHENEKLWRIRDKTVKLEMMARKNYYEAIDKINGDFQ